MNLGHSSDWDENNRARLMATGMLIQQQANIPQPPTSAPITSNAPSAHRLEPLSFNGLEIVPDNTQNFHWTTGSFDPISIAGGATYTATYTVTSVGAIDAFLVGGIGHPPDTNDPNGNKRRAAEQGLKIEKGRLVPIVKS